MTINKILEKIQNYHKKVKIPVVPQSNVVSPLFPGQFNYCLDEIHLFKKYNDFVEIYEEEHFQKIQPAIRLADFDRFFIGKEHSDYHLATFTISTINGGHIVSVREEEKYYFMSINGVLEFLVNQIGLKKERLYFSYFSGGATAREVEASRKKEGQKLRIEVDWAIPEDILSLKILKKFGIKDKQLIPCNTRDNFLTLNWFFLRAPWGYRNEIFYKMNDGFLLDIATIERMAFAPIIEDRGGEKYIIGVKNWHNAFNIDAFGLERVALATIGNGKIWDLPEYKKFITTEFSLSNIEGVRILHRVFTDSSFKDITSKQRREKLNKITRQLNSLSLNDIQKILTINYKIYQKIFPELKSGIKKTIKEIADYRERSRDLSQTERNKKREEIRKIKLLEKNMGE